jgi:hypothetical protein
LWAPDVKGRTKFSKDAYAATIIIPKARVAELEPVKAAIRTLAAQQFQGVEFKHPLKDGDAAPGFGAKEKAEYYKGHLYFQASSSSKRTVKLVHRDRSPLDPIRHKDLLHRGALVRLLLSAGTYVLDGKPGINFFLDVVQYIGEGQRFGGGNVNALDALPMDEADGAAPMGAVGTGADPFAAGAPAPGAAQGTAAKPPARDPLL